MCVPYRHRGCTHSVLLIAVGWIKQSLIRSGSNATIPATQAHWIKLRPKIRGWGLEVDEQPPGEIGSQKDAEGCTLGVRLLVISVKHEAKSDEEEDLVKLGGVAGDTIAKIDAPGQARRNTVGAVRGSCQKAANAANGDAQAQRHGEKVTGPGAEAAQALDQADGNPAAQVDRRRWSCRRATGRWAS